VSSSNTTRRDFLKTSAGVAAATGAMTPYFWSSSVAKAESKNDRLTTAAIGVGGRGTGIGMQLRYRSNMVAVCDVDQKHAKRFQQMRVRGRNEPKLEIVEDYRKIIERKDIDAITCGTPDHWHTPIVLAALRAGKDVYCEKPLTLTIDEGKLLCKTVKETGRVLQVGTQQRTAYHHDFLRAIVIAQSGLLGKIKRITASLGGAPNSKSFATQKPPKELNWEMWLGQAPKVPYCPERCHLTFRWWHEYSGGKMTDWGAHHIDISQWAIGMQNSGPISVEPLMQKFPDAADKNGYNTATQFKIRCMFPNGVEMIVRHDLQNGVLIEGEKAKIQVNRGGLHGQFIQKLRASKKEKQEVEAGIIKLFNGRQPRGHMENFLDAVKDRNLPMSDVYTHHRALTTCHLCNIAIRTGRKITWDPKKEQAVGDNDINNNWLKRVPRKGYEFG